MTLGPGTRVAAELRALVEQLVTTEIGADQAERLAEGLARVRRELRGEPRVKWRPDEHGRLRPVDEIHRETSLFQGRQHPHAPPMTVVPWHDPTGRPGLRGSVRVSRTFEGTPDGVHGGYVAALFDDLLGGVPRRAGVGPAVTGTLRVKYRRITPVEVDLDLRAWLEHVRGRRILVKGTCHAAGQLTAEAEGLFVGLQGWDDEHGPRRVTAQAPVELPTVPRPGTPADVQRVLVLNNSAVPAVTPLEPAELDRLLEWASHFLVVDDSDGELAGFLLLLGPGAPYESPNYRWFSRRFDRFAYVDRVVVAPHVQRRGVGALLYDAAVAAGRESAPVLLAEVNIEPRNDESLSFHEALGFEPIGEQDTDGGAKRVVMLVRHL